MLLSMQIVVVQQKHVNYFNMSERRVLPPRVNRGRRPQQSEEEAARQDVLYDRIFQTMNSEMKQSPKPKSQKSRIQQKADSAQIEAEARQNYSNNRIYFPYSRSYHYYFDLLSFPRLEGSVSYAIDQNNAFHATYSQQDNTIKGDLKVGHLFNRKYFGLPIQDVHMPRTRDKNVCHGYLFANQDRKFHIDRSIYQLKQVLQNFDKLVETQKIKQFICLRKDIDLISILEDQLTSIQKKNILKKKIKILSERKQSMKNFIVNQDKNFFRHSLNQQLHDQIQELSLLLKYEIIMGQISFGESLRQQLKGCQQFKSPKLSKLFRYNQFQKLCLREETIKKISQKIGPKFFQKNETSQVYEISVPFIFFTFANPTLMTVCEKLLALRLVHQNQASFYMCKIFWKRVFGRDLHINKQMKPLQKYQYDKAMSTAMLQMYKWKKQQQSKGKKNQDKIIFPFADNLLNWQIFSQGSKNMDFFSRQNQLEISGRQFVCLSLFYSLYLSVSEIYEFVLSNQIMGELIANDFFAKAHNYMTQCIGTARIGILQQTLKKLTESVIRSDFEMNFKLKWVYNENLGIAYVIKTALQSEWETQKEDNQNGDEGESSQQGVHKKIK